MISCGDATSVDNTRLVSVSHSGSSCTFTVDPINTLASSLLGDATFTIPLSSTGGHSLDAAFTVDVGADSVIVVDSTISYSAPSGLKVGRNRTLVIDVLEHITENAAYTVSCGDATGVDNTKLTSVSHTGSSCTFTVDPIDALASSLQGDTSFTVPLSSTGGDSSSAAFTVNIGPDSTITYSAPTLKAL